MSKIMASSESEFMSEKFEIRVQFYLESARYLPYLPENHPCSRTHGHSFLVIVVLRGCLDPKTGWVRDYHEILRQAEGLRKTLDHRLLNEVPGLENPTTEILTRYIFTELKTRIPELHLVIIRETPITECSYPIY
jgi:6-pyruvoyltetrahydropterin/6-carboxytetrahydropterin synthase